MTFLTKLSGNTASQTSSTIVARLKPLDPKLRKSVTYDNGSVNANHQKVNNALGTDSHFRAPYHSWEKGTVENTIGLVKRWLPKKTNLSHVPDDMIEKIENWLSHRPRKLLGYKTPAEAFLEISFALAGLLVRLGVTRPTGGLFSRSLSGCW